MRPESLTRIAAKKLEPEIPYLAQISKMPVAFQIIFQLTIMELKYI